MPYALSFLDKSPIHGDETANDALNRTVALAQLAEKAGFRRFWVAEHHNAPGLASSAPEILIGFLLARTERIRIGSGGVMLQHYSAYKVAESFNLLASLAPGRVDLGVGKAPGGLLLSTRALQGAYDLGRKPSFEQQLDELDGFLRHPDKEAPKSEDSLAAYPLPPEAPQRFLLGASVESARLAAERGWNFVYAGHLHGDEADIARALDAYRRETGKSALLAVGIVAAETEAEAEKLASNIRLFRVEIEGGQAVNVGSRELALDYVRQAGASRYKIEERTPRVIRGTPQKIQAQFNRLHQEYGVEEFVVDCPLTDGAHRLRTIELLAAARSAIAA